MRTHHTPCEFFSEAKIAHSIDLIHDYTGANHLSTELDNLIIHEFLTTVRRMTAREFDRYYETLNL